jgi:SAM-dependent methyltransferase
MTSQQILGQVRRYYEGRLAEHGATPRGVDWNSAESQRLRFRELARLIDQDLSASVNDYGCGYGALASYLREIGHVGRYSGFDISPAMIEAARREYGGLPHVEFAAERSALGRADYTLASGIFNVRQQTGDEDWRAYVLATIGELAALSRKGFAFNMLSSYSDPGKRRDDLYYADPRELFDHCKRHVSRFVSLLHETPLYEFTMIVRL